MTPAIEQIAVALQDAIDNVGFFESVQRVSGDIDGLSLSDGHAVLRQLESEEPEELFGGQDTFQTFDREFELIAVVQESEKSRVAIDTRRNEAEAAVREAIETEPTLGGLAIDATIGVVSPIPNEAIALPGVVVPITVMYRTKRGKPNELVA